MTVERTDYQPYPYDLSNVQLEFDLDPRETRVRSKINVQARANTSDGHPLVLDGDQLDLQAIYVDGKAWSDYELDAQGTQLVIRSLPRSCTLEIQNTCQPDSNHALMGLYASGKSLLTQCEPQGFRRITWFADRPDVMATYRVTMTADAQAFPSLLSNGNLLSCENLNDGRQRCTWEDPFPKPSYLFALVAGKFDCREEVFMTASGREVLLQIYSDPGTRDRTSWAMESLKRAIRWDESRYGLELDLDRFMIVAAADFNMGAMENKGLNIFNDAYVLAEPTTATDTNYRNIEAVIGHEYFHNWTGNRVTCRDWFQLSLKEGLTVFREQHFAADMLAEGLDDVRAASARAIKRIDDVAILRNSQFPEDAGPMAHPVRPQSYEEINNFYTATIYEKGAEIVRMLHTLLGETQFREGLDLYFQRHDGQAVTCEELVYAMQDAAKRHDPQVDLSRFLRWYDQAGTPLVTVGITPTETPDQVKLVLEQSNPPVGIEIQNPVDKPALHIPFAMGAIDRDGKPLTLSTDGQSGQTLLLDLVDTRAEWLIDGWSRDAIPSLLRDFSAPVRIKHDLTLADQHILARHDPNAFARREAMQALFTQAILSNASVGTFEDAQLGALVDTLATILTDGTIDDGYRARLLSLPGDAHLLQQMSQMDPLAIARARMDLIRALGMRLAQPLLACVHSGVSERDTDAPFDPGAVAAGQRAMTNLALDWLCQAGLDEGAALAAQQYCEATNMTDQMGALQALFNHPHARALALETAADFYDRFKDDALVVDKWFALQASAASTTVSDMQTLMQHPAANLRNPNRLRALVFQFCINNPTGFHAPAQLGELSGYDFWAQQVCTIDADNPEIAARLARVMDHWNDHIPESRLAMKAALDAVSAQSALSRNTREVVDKALSIQTQAETSP